MLSFNRAVQRAQMDLAEAISLRKPVAPVPPTPSPFAVPRPAQQQPPQMPQPMAQMPGAPGMPFQAPQQITAGMPGMGQMSPFGQAQPGQPSLRFARGGHVSMFAVKRKK